MNAFKRGLTMLTAVTTVAAIALAGLASSATAAAGWYGTIVNNSNFEIIAIRVGDGVIDQDDCVSWNQDGTEELRPYTWFKCQRYSIGAHTETGTWFDADGFRPNYGQSGYYVRFGSGSWKWIDRSRYTVIEDDQTATCSQNTAGVMHCTVS